jgi:hypothetical protein
MRKMIFVCASFLIFSLYSVSTTYAGETVNVEDATAYKNGLQATLEI